MSWLKVANITSNNDGSTTSSYHQPNPYYPNGIVWAPWQNTSQLVLLDGNAEAAQWLAFNGQWGPSWPTPISQTPPLPSGAGTELYDLAQAGNALGILSSKYTNESGPLGPQAQGWNVSNEGVAGTFEVLSAQNGLALDAGANQSGTYVWMWTLNGSSNQWWNIQPSGSGVSITSVQSGLALDGGSNQSGTNPQTYTSTGTTNQQWLIQPSGSGYSITSVKSGLALEAAAVGTYPQLYQANGSASEQWTLQ